MHKRPAIVICRDYILRLDYSHRCYESIKFADVGIQRHAL